MGRGCAASARASGPPLRRKVPRRRAILYESFVDNIYADGKTVRTSIRYTLGRYSRERSKRRLSRGESLWSDGDRRPEYLAKLREKHRKFRGLRERDRNRYDAKASAIYAEAYDQGPETSEFYGFLKTLESYREVLNQDTSLILSTGSPLFQLFKSFTVKPGAPTSDSAAE